MKHILMIAFILSMSEVFSQDRQSGERLQAEFEKLISKGLKPDSTAYIIIHTDSNKSYEVSVSQNIQAYQLGIKTSIDSIKPEIEKNYRYSYHFFKDSIRDKVYAKYSSEQINELTHYEVPASYPSGINDFRKIIFAMMEENIDSSKLDQYDWGQKIQFKIKSSGEIIFLDKNNLTDLLDVKKLRKWHHAIELGYPVTAYFETDTLLKEDFLKTKTFDFQVNRLDYFSIDPQNQEVKASKEKPSLSEQKIVLSYIFLYDEFLDPIILKGEPKENQELIDFLAMKDYYFDNKLYSKYPVTVYIYQEKEFQ